MISFGLLKTLLTSKTLRRSSSLVVIMAIGGDQLIKYVDKKHNEAVTSMTVQASHVEKRLDRKDLNDDERHAAVMRAINDLQASFKVIDARTYDLWKSQQDRRISVYRSPE